jgi:hypothetical protein
MASLRFLSLVLAVLPPADDVGEPPVAGRPANFSGAIGSYQVETRAHPTTLQAEDPLTLTVRITSKGWLRGVTRPDLGRLPRFASKFQIENGSERDLPAERAREYDYRLRPRTADVKEVPSLPFGFFKPGLLPPSRGYQTVYAKAIPLTVTPREAVPSSAEKDATERDTPPEAVYSLAIGPQVLRYEHEPVDFPSEYTLVSLILLSIVLAGLLYGGWRDYWDGRVRLLTHRRGGPARESLEALLDLATRRSADQVGQVPMILSGYLHKRLDSLPASPSPAEVIRHLKQAGVSGPLAEEVGLLLEACDAAYFAPEPRPASSTLAADASRLILSLESQPWSVASP